MFRDWKDREQTGGAIQWDVWNDRMKRIYDLVASDFLEDRAHSVLDLGAGQMYLRELLPDNIEYYPVDYLSRCAETLVCDFELHQFPQKRADIVVAAGILHFVSDAEWFLEQVFQHCGKKFVLTDCPLELETDLKKREQVYLWRNHYTYVQLCQLLHKVGFLITHTEKKCYDGRVDQMILVLEKATPEKLPEMVSCTGCGVCAEGCPAAALEMAYDGEGFLRPIFHEKKCIRCGKCLRTCPVLRLETRNSPDPESYAVWAPDEIRLQSSSGGAFSLLALEVLRQDGAVCGARYQPENRLIEHVVIRDAKDLPALRGSKYIQSDIRAIYKQVQEILEHENIPVLFSGCPCQVAALYAYLGREYENLYTVDLLCGGVTAPGLFQKYLEENWDTAKIKNVNCRTKKFGWNSTYITIEYVDGSTKSVHIEKDPFEKLFHSFAGQRECCYACVFSTFPRQGDITLGDFWGVQNYDAALDDGKGTSFVCINNEKGKRLFEQAKGPAVMLRRVPWQYTGTNRLSPFLAERVKLPDTRERFYHLLEIQSYGKAVESAVGGKYDVGVVCNWSGDNYGAQLTQYAFYRVLTDMGLEAVMIERPNMPYPGGNAATARLFRRNPYPSYATHALFEDTDEMRRINDLADIFIVPSDQLWNALFAEKDLFALGYVANNKKKISYATSFGCDPHNWKEDERAREAFFLKQFDAISVREDSGIRILQESFGIKDAEQTLDPVFLHDADFYRELSKCSRYAEKKIGLAAFILDPDESKEQYIRRVCSTLSLESIQICDVNTTTDNGKLWDLPIECNVRIEDLLAVFQKSDFIVTDSFHGVCLAIIFQKDFVAIGNAKRGLARFQSILKQFHLEERLILDLDTVSDVLLQKKIDYSIVEELLNTKRKHSLHWLSEAIRKPKEASLTTYDILDRELLSERSERRKLEMRASKAEQQIEERQNNMDTELLRVNGNIDAINMELLQINQRADVVSAQLTEEIQTSYAVNAELLRINGCIDTVNAELLRVNQRADVVSVQLTKEIQTSDAVNAELLRINGCIDTVNAELLRVNQRADIVSAQLTEEIQTSNAVNAELLRINGCIDAINAELIRINQKIDAINLQLHNTVTQLSADLLENRQRFTEIEERICSLEGSIFFRIERFFVRVLKKIRNFFLKITGR